MLIIFSRQCLLPIAIMKNISYVEFLEQCPFMRQSLFSLKYKYHVHKCGVKSRVLWLHSTNAHSRYSQPFSIHCNLLLSTGATLHPSPVLQANGCNAATQTSPTCKNEISGNWQHISIYLKLTFCYSTKRKALE